MDSLTKKISSFFDYDKENIEADPHALWLFILASSALAIILILWFGVSIFLRVQNASFFGQANVARRVPSVTIDEKKLTETTARYEERRETQGERKDSRLWVEDPSF